MLASSSFIKFNSKVISSRYYILFSVYSEMKIQKIMFPMMYNYVYIIGGFEQNIKKKSNKCHVMFYTFLYVFGDVFIKQEYEKNT